MRLGEVSRVTTVPRRYDYLVAIAFLGTLNVLVFRHHYVGNDFFPWDFWKTYYAVVAFWTGLVHHGTVPQWVPFQYMGYPFFLNPQSGFFYPPLWYFALTGAQYTLHAAVVLQALHVLWGAYGAFLLARVVTGDWRAGLFAGVAFHFFGGFYSNAEHVDIVRAYAWLPWIFWGATIRGQIAARNCLLPLLIFFAISGSYPGNIGSHIFLLGIYLVIQAFQARSEKSDLQSALLVIGLAGLGIFISAPVILPNVFLRAYLHHTAGSLPRGNWSFHEWVSLVSPWTIGRTAVRGFTGDASMTSAYIGVPALALPFLLQKQSGRHCFAWWLLLGLGLVLALGSISYFYNGLISIVPVLGLSRFPSSDYRAVAALCFIVLAAVSLRALLASGEATSGRRLAARAGWSLLIPSALLANIFDVFLPLREVLFVCLLWLGFVFSVVFCVRWRRHQPYLLLLLVLFWTCLNGWHVLNVSNWMWHSAGINLDDYYTKNIGFPTFSEKARGAAASSGSATRPARETRRRELFSWVGYLDGSYQTGDYGNTELEAQYRIVSAPPLLNYMKLPLTPVIFPNKESVTRQMLLERLSERRKPADGGYVSPNRYGLNSVTYHVRLPRPAVVVVNEIWFPGWEADLTTTTSSKVRTKVTATSIDGMIRAWPLPKGEYKMVARFRTPYLGLSLLLSLMGLVAYLLLLAWLRLGTYSKAT